MICSICSQPLNPCQCPQVGTLAEHRAEMVERYLAFNAKYESPEISEEERGKWEDRRLEVELALSEIEEDPLGYLARILGAMNIPMRKQTARFTQ